MKIYLQKITLLSMFLILFSCGDGGGPPKPLPNDFSSSDDIRVSFYEVGSQERNSYKNLLQSTISMNDNYQISTFGQIGNDGYASSIEKLYMYDAIENVESVMLLDDNNEPSFIYEVDVITGIRSNGITEFERIDSNSFYLRLYDYDWTNRLGTLLFESIISENGGEFISAPTYDISASSASKLSSSKLEDGQFSASSKIKGKSFKTPIVRLEQILIKSSSQELSSTDLNKDLEGYIEDLTGFRNAQIPKFLKKIRNAGLATTIGAGAAILGGAAATPLFVGAAGVTAVAAALDFFISDDYPDFINEVRTGFSNLQDNTGTSISGIVENIKGYNENASTFLNENLRELRLSEILQNIDEEDLIVTNEDLNDLPDSNGVLQIGLSWNNGGTDIDLYVTDPIGTTIYYDNPSSSSGGFLDRDDIDGFGPENIFWNGNYPDGTYMVSVNYFGCDSEVCPSTNYTVKISDGLGFQKTFTGNLSFEGETINVTRFSVSGGQISTSM